MWRCRHYVSNITLHYSLYRASASSAPRHAALVFILVVAVFPQLFLLLLFHMCLASLTSFPSSCFFFIRFYIYYFIPRSCLNLYFLTVFIQFQIFYFVLGEQHEITTVFLMSHKKVLSLTNLFYLKYVYTISH